MYNAEQDKIEFIRGKISIDIFVVKFIDETFKEWFLEFNTDGVTKHESWFDTSWCLTPGEADEHIPDASRNEWVIDHIDINRYTPKPSAENNTLYLQCSDGTLHFARQAYNESELVKDLIDNCKGWIASHTMRDVSDELEGLYMK